MEYCELLVFLMACPSWTVFPRGDNAGDGISIFLVMMFSIFRCNTYS